MSASQAPKPKPVPGHYTSVASWLVCPSAAQLITFMQAAFGAQELPNSRLTDQAGGIMHAVVQLGDARLQLFDSRPD